VAITTVAEQYARLRSYLNPYIKGPNVDAVLTALASGNAAYLINNVRAVNDQLYIATASAQYLDALLAKSGIVRPSNVGLSDDVFRQIGIAVKNRKQVRDLMNDILDAVFGDEFVRASVSSTMFEPYHLTDGDTLTINFDESTTVTVTFHASQFQNIAMAKAQEVADAIVTELRNLGFGGTAIMKNDGNGPYVEILSDTIGPASSVTIEGGSAQNVLVFPTAVPAGGNGSTQWTTSLQPGGVIRFTWTGGANPNLGKVQAGNYVNIFGGGFTGSPNSGSYTITNSVGGIAGASYFEVLNPLGVSGTFTQGSTSAVLFYNPTKQTLNSRHSYAAIYQVQSRMLQIFLPASTKVIRRSRIGSAHIHYDPQGTFKFFQQPSSGDRFQITTTISLVAGADFVIGSDIPTTVNNLVAAINALSANIVAIANTGSDSDNIDDILDTVLVLNNSINNTLVMSYTGSDNVVASGPLGDNTSLLPNQPGPYAYDLSQPFVISSTGTLLSQNLNTASPRIITVKDASKFPDALGYIVLGYGTSHQEGPIPYISRPSNTTLLISPAYTIQNVHPLGTDVALVAQKSPVRLTQDGTNYPFYLTDVVSGRIYAQDLINSVAATGITIVFTILYPNDIGLGEWGTANSEISTIWGP
jgi:hypothetical protein